MRFWNRFAALAALPLLLLTIIWSAFPALSAPAWHAAVDGWVLERVAETGEAEFLVFLSEQADLSAAAAFGDRAARGAYVMQELRAVAERTQPAVLAELERLGVDYRPYWVANMIWVRGDAAAVELLAQRGDVAHLYANPRVQMALPESEEAPMSATAVEPNISVIQAPAAWAAGIDGSGVVVGGQDTGYVWNHPALINQYRGWNGAQANHDYNWYDAVHFDLSGNGTNPCGFDSQVPCDDNSHGTHTMGTILGDDGGVNQIGVAPGARWIGCRNMEQGVGTPATYSECFQWFIAPTDLEGDNPQPALAPAAIGNSWSCPPDEGCVTPQALQTVVANVRQAGIVVVAAAGNSGPGCSTINTPPAIYDDSFTIGATTNSDVIASFSSRGPVLIDGSNRLKPDVTAPGSGVRSSGLGTSYTSKSGTSMATPHVAGLVALLLQARPDLDGDVEAIETLIRETAVPLTSSAGCGGLEPAAVPNHVYGYGRIDALRMLEDSHELFIDKVAEPAAVNAGEQLTYTISVSDPQPLDPATGLVLTETLPANVTLVSATEPYMQDGDTLTWTRASLPVGESWEVTFVVDVAPDAIGEVVNEIYMVSSDQVEARSGTPVQTPIISNTHELFIDKVAEPAEVSAGEPLTYTISVNDAHASAPATGLVLTDTLPANVTLVSATEPYMQDGDTLTWTRASLPVGESWEVTFVVDVAPDAIGEVVNEIYMVSSDQVEARSGTPVHTPILAEETGYSLHLPIMSNEP